jgi:hypothetical protein
MLLFIQLIKGTKPMTSHPEEANLVPKNHAHPLTEINLSGGEAATIEHAMLTLEERRNELADEQPSQLFSGIVPTERGNLLVVVDSNTTSARYPQYVVRTGMLADLAEGGTMAEEYIPDDPRYRTYNREPKQNVQTTALGKIRVGQGRPVTPLELRRTAGSVGDVPFVSIYKPDGTTTDAVSLDDVFSEVTPGDEMKPAQDALDIGKNRALYPNVNNDPVKFPDNRYYPSGREDRVNSSLRPIKEALTSELLNDDDRARLVTLGQNIMQIANDNPENVGGPDGSRTIINPEEARAAALAENAGRQLPNGLFGRKRERNREDTDSMVYAAQDAYRESLRQPHN